MSSDRKKSSIASTSDTWWKRLSRVNVKWVLTGEVALMGTVKTIEMC